MSGILLITQFVFAALIAVVVLLQKSSSIGLGAYSGSNESLFGAKGPAGFLAKATFVLGFVFVINTIALGYFYSQESTRSVIDKVDTKTLVPSSAPTAPLDN
ncbi:MAG: preprotein translocase subunit SecG [Wolinella succinogenes]|uniref:preprotein translocase subunit SecG n=1 Tax=Wolinella succinogenes TaxID=844 RepID=UPI001692B94C|nr:preprotein translocase subunit SecG [Wolinella succinogenes]NLU35056.1 preprotein translocase subunit SecG [Wolinella succinogenes]